MEMTTVKSAVVLAIIFGCFAVLYPKIFHPMLMHTFSGGEVHQKDDDLLAGRMPPHLRKPGPSTTKQTPVGDDISRHMKAGPHPGMRAAAEMKKQAAQTQGGSGGKGMMAIVLPMYAVGIVIYLIYTMTKVFGKKDQKEEGRDYLSSHFSDIHYNADKQKFSRQGTRESDDDEDDEMRAKKKSKRKQRDLERLLMKADRDKISELEVVELKRRLLETEEQMTRILQAMETVTQQVDTAAEAVGEQQGEDGEEEEEEEGEETARKPGEAAADDDDVVLVKSVASSPDTESYEFLNAQTPEREHLQDLPQQEPQAGGSGGQDNVETIGAAASSLSSEHTKPDLAAAGDHATHSERDYEDDFEEYEDTEEEEIEEDIVLGEGDDSKDTSGDELHPDLRKRLPPKVESSED